MTVHELFPRAGHHTRIDSRHDIIFGAVYRPVCADCDWTSGYVRTTARAEEIAAEHAEKTAGTWRAAK